MVDVKDHFQRTLALPGVFGVMILNEDCLVVKTNLSNDESIKYAGQIGPLVDKTRKLVQEILIFDDDERSTQSRDELNFIRLRTSKHEILISPSPDNEYVMVALQRPVKATGVVVTLAKEEEEAHEEAQITQT